MKHLFFHFSGLFNKSINVSSEFCSFCVTKPALFNVRLSLYPNFIMIQRDWEFSIYHYVQPLPKEQHHHISRLCRYFGSAILHSPTFSKPSSSPFLQPHSSETTCLNQLTFPHTERSSKKSTTALSPTILPSHGLCSTMKETPSNPQHKAVSIYRLTLFSLS